MSPLCNTTGKMSQIKQQYDSFSDYNLGQRTSPLIADLWVILNIVMFFLRSNTMDHGGRAVPSGAQTESHGSG